MQNSTGHNNYQLTTSINGNQKVNKPHSQANTVVSSIPNDMDTIEAAFFKAEAEKRDLQAKEGKDNVTTKKQEKGAFNDMETAEAAFFHTEAHKRQKEQEKREKDNQRISSQHNMGVLNNMETAEAVYFKAEAKNREKELKATVDKHKTQDHSKGVFSDMETAEAGFFGMEKSNKEKDKGECNLKFRSCQ
jgi:hypothetical protein